MHQFTSDIEALLRRAIEEDVRTGDITSELCIPKGTISSAHFVFKQAGVVAALPFIQTLFAMIDENVSFTQLVQDGTYVTAGTLIAKVSGPVVSLLTGERIALNLLQHSSGVATMTFRYLDKIRGCRCSIMDTRKTLPGLRALEKYSVLVAGGENHRMGLDDRYTIKSNHIYFLSRKTTSPIEDAVKTAKEKDPKQLVEVEISRYPQLAHVLDTEADIIMLSRMMPSVIARCVKKAEGSHKKLYVESLGTITLETVRSYAETGVHGISIGSITHSVPASEIVMRFS